VRDPLSPRTAAVGRAKRARQSPLLVSVIPDLAPDQVEQAVPVGAGPPGVATAIDPTGVASTFGRVRDAYDAYYRAYKDALGRNPVPWVQVDAGSGPEDVVIDAGLWEQLFDVYAHHGWDGVRRVEDAIRQFLPSTPPKGSAWAAAWPFFLAVRRLLAGVVAAELRNLEFSLTTWVEMRLPTTGKTVQATIDLYQATETVTRSHAGKDEVEFERRTYAFGSATQTHKLVEGLRKAVEGRVAYEKELQRLANVRAQIHELRTIYRKSVRLFNLYDRRGKKYAISLKEEEAALLEERARVMYRNMLALVGQRAPLDLLVVEGLQPGFLAEDAVGLLGRALFELRERVDALVAAVDTDRSRVSEILTDQNLNTPAQPRTRSAEGPERIVIDAALKGLERSPEWGPLVHEQTLHALVESGQLPRDSIGYVVWTGYVRSLIAVLDERRALARAWTEFWSWFARAASALSLALLITPAAKVSPLMRGVAGVAELATVAHSVSSVTGQLAQLSRLTDVQLLGSDAFSIEGLGRLGELGAFRRNLVDGLTQQVAVEMLLVMAGGRWPAVKQLLIARGVYADLQTLLED